MYCIKCGNALGENARFCTKCGAAAEGQAAEVHERGVAMPDEKIYGPENAEADVEHHDITMPDEGKGMLFRLVRTPERNYSVMADRQALHIQGEFWNLRDKEFIKNRAGQDSALIRNFIGMGYLAKRSPKKTMRFVVAAFLLETVKTVVDKVSDWIDKANKVLWIIDKSVELPEWVNVMVNVAAVGCLVFAVMLFFSKKKMIEISFTDKRICVPEKSMTPQEFNGLYHAIKEAEKGGYQ